MLHPTRAQADRVGDRDTRARAVCDDDETVQPEEVAATVRLRVEPLPEVPRARPDEEPAEPSTHGGAELRAQRVEQGLDPPPQRLQSDVAGEAVRDDHVRSALEEEPALDVAREAEVGSAKE